MTDKCPGHGMHPSPWYHVYPSQCPEVADPLVHIRNEMDRRGLTIEDVLRALQAARAEHRHAPPCSWPPGHYGPCNDGREEMGS